MSTTQEKKPTIPTNHVSIMDKKCSVDVDDILNEDCELVLFELPKGFDKSLLSKMTIKNFKKNGKEMKLLDNFKGICFDEQNPLTKQSLIMVNDSKKEKIVLKPVDRYVKVFETFDIAMPNEDSIMKRPLKYKQEKKIKAQKSSAKKSKKDK